jgi:hypothetical protein
MDAYHITGMVGFVSGCIGIQLSFSVLEITSLQALRWYILNVLYKFYKF